MTHTEMRSAMERYQDFRRTADAHRAYRATRATGTTPAPGTSRTGTSTAQRPTRSRRPATPAWLLRLAGAGRRRAAGASAR